MACYLAGHIARVFVVETGLEFLEDLSRCDIYLVIIADHCSNRSAQSAYCCCPSHNSNDTSNYPSDDIPYNWHTTSSCKPKGCSECNPTNATCCTTNHCPRSGTTCCPTFHRFQRVNSDFDGLPCRNLVSSTLWPFAKCGISFSLWRISSTSSIFPVMLLLALRFR